MGAFQETLTARKAVRLNPEHYPLLPTLKEGEKIVAMLLMTPLRLQVLEDFTGIQSELLQVL